MSLGLLRIPGRAALAALLLLGLPTAGQAWSEFGFEDEPRVDPDGPAIREPVFEFLLTAARDDSLGVFGG